MWPKVVMGLFAAASLVMRLEGLEMATNGNGRVPKFGILETRLASSADLPNPFRDGELRAEFLAPSGQAIAVEGFYAGGNEWRVRFVPREHGAWTWRATLRTPGANVSTAGTFVCEGTDGHGFLRTSPRNPFRLEHEDGTPFYPIGIQTCNFLNPDFDGPAADGSWRSVSNDVWLAAFTGAVNLVRTQFGQGTREGCALALIPAPPKGAVGAPTEPIPLDRYDLELAARIDAVYYQHRAAGMRQILILFQDMSLWGEGKSAFGSGRDLSPSGYKSVHAANLPAQEQYVRYIVARWGCFVDVWELFNEDAFAPNDYLARLAGIVRAADPYRHILTTNYDRPGEPWCEIVTWHEYMGMPANQVDAYLVQQIALFKSRGKPVLNTEFGNQGQLSNVDPVKWRIAAWTAFMNESSLLFWGMSGRVVPAGRDKPGGNANAYIGADTRRHFHVLNAFARDLPIDLRPVPCGYHGHGDIRTAALSNGRVAVVYLHHFADHSRAFQLSHDLGVQTGPGRFRLRWIDPEDGRLVLDEERTTPQQYLMFRPPPVTVDLACTIQRLDDVRSAPDHDPGAPRRNPNDSQGVTPHDHG